MFTHTSPIVSALAGIAVIAVSADAPGLYAIRNARIVTAAGPDIARGTVVIRNGLIEAVGANASAPDTAYAIDGSGLVVYPGLIDMGTSVGVDMPDVPQPQGARTRMEVERWKRSVILRPQVQAATYLNPDTPDLNRLAGVGITTALALPKGAVVSGQSALVNVIPPEDDPQIGTVAQPRAGLAVVRTPVALHVAFSNRPAGDAYPVSLMGVIAFVRQAFLDAQRYPRVQGREHDPSLQAMQAAAEGKMPVAFEANSAREIARALDMAAEFKLKPIITGATGAADVVADLKSRAVPVLVSLNYPTRPRNLAPDADEALSALRERANAPKVPAALARAGVAFAFQSDGLRDMKDFVKNVGRAVKEGLAPDAAVRGLTIDAAKIAGVADRLGSIEKGKVANLIVTDRDLFDEKAAVKHVFIEGRLVRVPPDGSEPRGGERRGRGAPPQ